MEIKVWREHPQAKLPTKAHLSDHCWDLYACVDTYIYPGATTLVTTGLRIQPPEGYAMIIKERSGKALEGILIGAGVVDSGYRGPINIVARFLTRLPTYGDLAFFIKAGTKIAQFKLEKTIESEVIEISESEFNKNTERGEKGFGSSGI